MSRFRAILGGIFLAVGLLWVFQGVGLVGGSFMTGDSTWTYIGVATAVIGAVLLLRRAPH